MSASEFGRIIEFIKELYPGEDPVPLHAPRFLGREKEYLAQCIDTTFVSYVGAFVTRFEEEIKAFTGVKYAVATVNGTAALHLALLCAGVGEGDDVIVPPLTFVGTCNPIIHAGAQPCFVDIDPDSLGLSPEALREFLEQNARRGQDGFSYNIRTGRRLAACVPVHVFGHAADMAGLASVCAEWNIQIIEDAAESLGSFVNGVHTGNVGRAAILSFNGNKTVTTGGGGMLLSNDEELAAKARHISTTAKKPHAWEFVHDVVGYNYRLPNVNAALGCAQMEYLEQSLNDKRETARLYQAFFNDLGRTALTEQPNVRCNYWLNGFFAKDRAEREAFLNFAKQERVQARPVWTLMTELPMFRQCTAGPHPNAVWVADRLINIPSSVRLSEVVLQDRG